MNKKAINADADEVLTLKEASTLLKVGLSTVSKLANCGIIPARKVGREWRFHRTTLLEWLKEPAKDNRPCWEIKQCEDEIKNNCVVYGSVNSALEKD